MTAEEAIHLAVEAVRTGSSIDSKRVHTIRQERHMNYGKIRCGGLVVIPLNLPTSFEPNIIDVEVYERDGEVNSRLCL